MRLTVWLFGREVLAFSTDGDTSPVQDPGTVPSQVELAEQVRVGFVIDHNPSLED